MNRPVLLLLLSLSSFACGRAQQNARPAASAMPRPAPAAASAVSKAPPRTDLQPTAMLVSRPEIQGLVDQLAAVERIAADVTVNGRPNPEYALFTRLRLQATDAEMLALLVHESPIVRGYAAQHVIERDLEAPLLVPLLADQTPVAALHGCVGSHMPISWVTVIELCGARNKTRAAEHLRTLARGSGERAEQARRCLAEP